MIKLSLNPIIKTLVKYKVKQVILKAHRDINIKDKLLTQLSKHNIFLTQEQINNIVFKISQLGRLKSENIKNGIEDLKVLMKDNYNQKSNDRLQYFLNNFLIGVKVAPTTNSIKNNGYSGGIFKYRDCYSNINIHNSNKIEDFKIEFNKEKREGQFLSNQDKIYSFKKISKVMYLDYINRDKEKIFITFTLPKEYHKYRQYNNRFVEKSKYNDNSYKDTNYLENIKNGLMKLNEIHRYFYELLKKKLSRILQGIEIDFIKILEPHKSLVGHLHSMFYIDNKYLNIIQKVYDLTIKKFKLTQTRYELLNNAKGSTYLNKYLMKTTRSENLFYNHYKRYFSSVRFFTSSNFKYTNQTQIDLIYKYLYKYKKKLVERLKKANRPYFYLLEQMVINKTFTFEIEKVKRVSFDNKKLQDNYKNLTKTIKDKSIIKNIIISKINTYFNLTSTKIINKMKRKNKIVFELNEYK